MRASARQFRKHIFRSATSTFDLGGFPCRAAHRAALEILQLPPSPTAILVCNNRMTLGLMRAQRDLALKCPEDVSVVGFDDFDWSDLFSSRLTTVVQPSYEMGKRATEVLLQVIQAPDKNHPSGKERRIVLKAELCVRESTAPPAGSLSRPQQNLVLPIVHSSPDTEPAS